MERLFPIGPDMISNGRLIREISEILILIERKLGIRVVYLELKRFGFGILLWFYDTGDEGIFWILNIRACFGFRASNFGFRDHHGKISP